MRFILASSSPARLTTLRNAGLHAEVLVPDVDEASATADSPAALTGTLAQLKAHAVLDALGPEATGFALVACDSMLELDGKAWGKPADPQEAIQRWRLMRGRTARLNSGHHVVVDDRAGRREVSRVGTTHVTFADLSDEEIDAYVATGEPTRVAGGFAIDGLGGPYITQIRGDYHNVVGISLPLLRQMLLDLGLNWHELCQPVA